MLCVRAWYRFLGGDSKERLTSASNAAMPVSVYEYTKRELRKERGASDKNQRSGAVPEDGSETVSTYIGAVPEVGTLLDQRIVSKSYVAGFFNDHGDLDRFVIFR
jgi:hypothetical protein